MELHDVSVYACSFASPLRRNKSYTRAYLVFKANFEWRALLKICTVLYIRPFHISHNAPYLPPKILHNLCFSFLLGITPVPREIENDAYAKNLGAGLGDMRCIMGDEQVAYGLKEAWASTN